MEDSKLFIGYNGRKPVYATENDYKLYEQRKKLKLGSVKNEGNFMANLGKAKDILGRLAGYGIVSILAFMLGVIYVNSNTVEVKEPAQQVLPKNEIKLSEYKLLWDTETQEVTLMNRKNTTVTLVLSKEVTTAVFSLKASAIQSDFSRVTNGGVAPKKSYPSKATSQTKPTQSSPK
jgi:hypothetical protein